MAIHSSILAWEMPWTEAPGGLQSMGSQRVRHDLVTKTTQQKKEERKRKKKNNIAAKTTYLFRQEYVGPCELVNSFEVQFSCSVVSNSL